MSGAFDPMLTTAALLLQQLGLVWNLLLKADPEGPALIFHAALQHSLSSSSEPPMFLQHTDGQAL
jgi:hypothetical protein